MSIKSLSGSGRIFETSALMLASKWSSRVQGSKVQGSTTEVKAQGTDLDVEL
jgi:hypothetical protein